MAAEDENQGADESGNNSNNNNSRTNTTATGNGTNNVDTSATPAVTAASANSTLGRTPPTPAARSTPPAVAARTFLAAAQQEMADATTNDPGAAAATAEADSAPVSLDPATACSVAAVSAKLEQVKGYVAQTTIAMTALEDQADMSKIGQYNTLVKVLRELKVSEVKLTSHLATLRSQGVTPANSYSSDVTNQQSGPTSQVIGIVSSRTVDAVDDNGTPPTPTPPPPTPAARSANAPTMSERLAAGMAEAEQITGRLRDNVVRREDLVERYRATRERLAALKRQRRDIAQQERTLLVANSPRDSPYEDPIPGASGWTLDEINTGLVDFRALYEKVATLRTAYDTKSQGLDESDTTGRAEVAAKQEQLSAKRSQLVAVITQLKRIRLDRMREQGMEPELDTDDFGSEPSSSADTSTSTAAGGATDGGSASPGTTRPAGGSVSIGTLPPILAPVGNTTAPSAPVNPGPPPPTAEVIAARAELEAAGRELQSRTTHLANLKEELAGMKRLLDVTAARAGGMPMNDDEAGPSGSAGSARSAGPSSSTGASSSSQSLEDDHVHSVGGNVIAAADLQRQDPVVIAKYQQLRDAKRRMAEMEEIMQAISAARGSGRQLSQVLTATQLTLLKQAEEEEDPSGEVTRQRLMCEQQHRARCASTPSTVREVSPAVGVRASDRLHGRLPPSLSPPPTRGRVTLSVSPPPARRRAAPSLSPPARGRGRGTTPSLSPPPTRAARLFAHNTSDANVDTRRRETGADGGQRRHLAKQRNADPQQEKQGGDPRDAAIAALQEEVRQKKNALEAVMRGMGKTSSLHPDNISDNISDGASDGRYSRTHSAEPTAVPRSCGHRGQQPHGDGAPSNLYGGGQDRSVRPKHNTRGGRSADVPRPETTSANQHTISDALRQLSSVQGSINSLYDTLRTEQEVRTAPLCNTQQQGLQHLQQQGLQHLQQQGLQHLQQQGLQHLQQQGLQHLQQQGLQHLQQQGLQQGANSMGQNATTAPVLPAGVGDADVNPSLQQCYAQLYLHSLEIQALNKHVQVSQHAQALQQQMILMGGYNGGGGALQLLPSVAAAGYGSGLSVLPSLAHYPAAAGLLQLTQQPASSAMLSSAAAALYAGNNTNSLLSNAAGAYGGGASLLGARRDLAGLANGGLGNTGGLGTANGSLDGLANLLANRSLGQNNLGYLPPNLPPF